jgi:hypothetical protein
LNGLNGLNVLNPIYPHPLIDAVNHK